MQPREWQQIAGVMENAWRGDMDEARSNAYFVLLEPYDTADVERALRVLVQNGNPFLPTASEIVAAINAARTSSVPTWPEAWAAISRAIRRHGWRGSVRARMDLTESHTMVASFVDAYGWIRMCREEVDHPQFGAAVLRRIGEAYAEHVERQQDREANGLAIAASQRRTLTGGPRRTNPAELLRGAA